MAQECGGSNLRTKGLQLRDRFQAAFPGVEFKWSTVTKAQRYYANSQSQEILQQFVDQEKLPSAKWTAFCRAARVGAFQKNTPSFLNLLYICRKLTHLYPVKLKATTTI